MAEVQNKPQMGRPPLAWSPPRSPSGEPPARPLCFLSASASSQHPLKTASGIPNADAVEEGRNHLGLCDGVSGVFNLGIPPHELPKDLLNKCGEVLRDVLRSGRFRNELDDAGDWLRKAVQNAYEQTQALGATTLLLAALKDNQLWTACLGDSALLVLRPTALRPLRLHPVLRTTPGRYDAQRPIQVQRLPEISCAQVRSVIEGALIKRFYVRPGDVIVLGSDGLFDNLEDHEITKIIQETWDSRFSGPGPQTNALPTRADLARIAQCLVNAAIKGVSAARPNSNADDTTALVALVLQDELLTAPSEVVSMLMESYLGDENCPVPTETTVADSRGPRPHSRQSRGYEARSRSAGFARDFNVEPAVAGNRDWGRGLPIPAASLQTRRLLQTARSARGGNSPECSIA